MRFANRRATPIDPGLANVISSDIHVSGIEGEITDVNVIVDVDHTFTSDLRITLVGPEGTRNLLVAQAGADGENFHSTIFDDQAIVDIADSAPPFTGAFRPQQSLEAFNQSDPNGTWTLEIQDTAPKDGGELKSWFLDVEVWGDDETLDFSNQNPVQISADRPTTLVSTIQVSGNTDKLVERIEVTVDIDHGFVQDLTLTLIDPTGMRVVLADRVGGGGNHYRQTTFSDQADETIRKGEPPFAGRFRPDGALADFAGKPVTGAWQLEVADRETGDGGVLNAWSLRIATNAERPVPASQFHIDVEFLGGLTATQQAVFRDAAARWSEIIVGDLPEATIDGTTVDDIVIGAQGQAIDGAGGPEGNILGQAGPTHLRDGSLLPIAGVMTFDTHDLDAMEADGSLLDVIVHEMGHVLGIGTLWSLHGLLQDPADGVGVDNPVFVGDEGIAEYTTLSGTVQGTPVPVADRGGPGTRNGHWRERVFDNELMTGWIDQGIVNPISRITIASLADLGYEVNPDAADQYGLPALLAGVPAREPTRKRECCTLHTPIDVRSLRVALASRTANSVIQEVKVGEKVSWNVRLASASGVTLGDAGEVDIEAVLTAPAKLPKEMQNPRDLDLQLDDVDKLQMLLVSSTVYDGKMEVKADGNVVALTGPLLLFGGAIKGFATSLDKLSVQNKSDQEAELQVMIGQKLTS